MRKTVLISGAISGDSGYRTKFSICSRILQDCGFSVMNPAILPDGFKHHQYMHITFAMLDVCEILCLLPDWRKSAGAIMELIHAILKHKTIVMYGELIQDPDCVGGDHCGIFHILSALRRES